MTEEAKYSVEVIRINTIDDLVGYIDLGHDSLYKKVKMRLLGIQSPEQDTIYLSTIKEMKKMQGTRCTITLHFKRGNSWIVTLWDSLGCNINEKLAKEGFIYIKQTVDANAESN